MLEICSSHSKAAQLAAPLLDYSSAWKQMRDSHVMYIFAHITRWTSTRPELEDHFIKV